MAKIICLRSLLLHCLQPSFYNKNIYQTEFRSQESEFSWVFCMTGG
ncbi:hypothetical protein [Nostoc sp. JL31]|nr:hypothetical protein [Nostoc sp. JL31]